MKKQHLYVQLLLFLLLCACPVWAGGDVWSINPDNSSVNFEVKKIMVITVKGEFTTFSGTVHYDGRNLQDADVSAEINASTIDTGLPKRDTDLKSNNFLDIIHYPKISFKSKKIIPEQSGAFKIIGLLSMHGQLKPVTLNAQPLKVQPDGEGKTKIVTVATTTLNRKDFGISLGWVDQAGTAIADKIKVILNIELVQAG